MYLDIFFDPITPRPRMARNDQSNGAAKHQYNVDRLESFRVDATDIDHGNDYPSLHSALPVTTRF